MTLTRVTQNMMMERSHGSLQTALGRLAKTQEHLSTGRVLNRPSDSPTDTTSAMRVRSGLADNAQHLRNAEDGLGWLTQIDQALTSSISQVRRARDLALQGANAATGSQGREALATEVDQLRASLVSAANTTYLERPVFGGVTTGSRAYDNDTGADVDYVGTAGAVRRTVADGVQVRVDADAATVFGAAGSTVFDDLADLSIALRSGDTTGIETGIDRMQVSMDRMTTALADVGTRANRLDRAVGTAKDAELSLTTTLTGLENVDLPRAMVDLQMQEVAYQASLATTARVMQPSLLDFLR